MPKAPLPIDEARRLETLYAYDILDTAPEAAFDDLARLAATIAGTPVSLLSLMDADRQWFKAKVGVDFPQTPREVAFCGYTILGSDLLEVPDTAADARFADNPLVTAAPHVRFYAGTPLVTPEGHAVGTLCVLDTVPRVLTASQAEALRMLGRQAVGQLRLRRTIRGLADSERFARSTVDALTSHIAVLDDRGKIVAVNQAWRQFAAANGGSGDVGGDYLSVCEGASGPCSVEAATVAAGIREVLGGHRDLFTLEYPCHSPAEQRWFLVRVSRFAGEGPTRLVVSHENVTERRLAAEQLRHDARHDALTGLPNRVLFAERVDRCIAMAPRRAEPFAVLFLDLDRFKIINDSLGHAAGDRLLTAVAERIGVAVRPSDLVARMGGDEFTVLLESLRVPGDAARVAERIRLGIAEPVLYQGQELTTTVSIGIVTCGGSECSGTCQTAKELIRDADAAMYKAKTAGKDRYVLFDQAMHAEVVARMTLEAELRRAVDRRELEVHYQPIVALGGGGRSSGPVGFEALVRWRRGGRLVSPADFIPVAEDTGMIVPIGAWVLRHACRQLAQWRAAGGPMADLYVTVNLSRRQLADPGLLALVRDVLQETGLPPLAVGLEITESAVMQDAAAAERTLDDIRVETGVRFLIDDFGTGYSSLSCLQRFPIDVLKIDRAFVQHVASDRGDAAVVRTIITLAHHLGMAVVGEGIETPEQAAFLADAGCDLSQGYLFSRPLEPAAAERFVQDAAAVALAA